MATDAPAAPPARCRRCPAPPAPGRVHCPKHLAEHRAAGERQRRRAGRRPAPTPLPCGLTPRQHGVLCFLYDYLAREGRVPTVREVMAGFGVGSTNGVVCHYRAWPRRAG
jgi:hypothetical protein